MDEKLPQALVRIAVPVMIDALESSFAGGACNNAVRAHGRTVKPLRSMVRSCSLAFTDIFAFIVFPSKALSFALQATRSGA